MPMPVVPGGNKIVIHAKNKKSGIAEAVRIIKKYIQYQRALTESNECARKNMMGGVKG